MSRFSPTSKFPRFFRASAKPLRARRTPALGAEFLEDRSLLSLTFGNVFGVGGNGAIGVETTSVAVDSSGNRYVTGSYKATVNFGGNGPTLTSTSNGLSDGYVAKYSPAGLLLWLKPFGGSLQDRAAGVAVDASGNAFVTGYYQGSVTFDVGQTLDSGSKPAPFFWELNPNGNTTFLISGATSGLAASVQPQSISVDPAGANLVVGGFFSGSLTLGSRTLTATSTNSSDLFVTKLSVSGSNATFDWSSQSASSGNSAAVIQSVAIDPSGNAITTGYYQGTVNFNPGGTADNHTSVVNGGPDIFLNKFNSSTGLELFNYTPGGTGYDFGSGVATDAAGNIYAIGGFQNGVGFPVNGSVTTLATNPGNNAYFLLEMNPTGTATLARQLNALTTNANVGTASIGINSSGTIAVAITYTGNSFAPGLPGAPTPVGGSDVLVETLDTSGNLIQQLSGGGASDDTATGVAITNSGRISVVGTYQGPATFGATTLQTISTTNPGANIFLAQINPYVVTPGDFIGNHTTQVSVYRPSTQTYYVQGSTTLVAPAGIPVGSLPVPGDYLGTGTNQQAYFDPGTATWYVVTSNNTVQQLGQFGWAGHDIPVPGDYDGIGKTELAVYRPSTAAWYVLSPSGSRQLPSFGWSLHDIPAPADYTGSGITQQAVYRPQTAQWFVAGQPGVFATFGWPGHDIPVPGNYLNTNKSEPAVYRPETAQWFVSGNSGVFTTFGWPTPSGQRPMNDIPSLARLGTLGGLPIFNSDGSISRSGGPSGPAFSAAMISIPTISTSGISSTSSSSPSTSTSASTPRTHIRTTLTPTKALPKLSFVKDQSPRHPLFHLSTAKH